MTEDGEETLSDYFWSVARQLRRRSFDAMSPWEITPSQSRALSVLTRHGALRLTDLAEHLRIAPRSATEVVDGLELVGYVERRPDPNDRRATLVESTDSGRAAGRAIQSARRAEAETYFAALSDGDRAHLIRILRTLNH